MSEGEGLAQDVLAGIRVLDFGRYIAGPYCAALLADLGADVIRIERRGGGEDRWVAPVGPDGAGAMYLAMNRNKRAMTLDPASAGGTRDRPEARGDRRRRRRQPAARGAARRSRSTSRASAASSRTSSSRPSPAFGAGGPWSHKHGFDGIGQLMCGSAYLTGTPDQPMRAAVAWVDCGTASLAAFGTLAALMARQKTRPRPEGRGRAAAHRRRLQQPHARGAAGHPGQPRRHAQSRPDLRALRRLPHQGRLDHRLRDRQPDVRAVGEAHGRGALAHRPALPGRPVARRQRRARLQADGGVGGRAHDRGGARGPRRGEVPAGAALLAAAGARGRSHPRGRAAPGHRVSRAASARRRSRRRRSTCPRRRDASAGARRLLGEHTDEVLAELGYGAEAIADLRTRGVI